MGNCCSNHKDIVYPAKFQPIPTNPPPEDVIDEFVKVNRAQANDEVVELDSKKLVDKQKFDKKHQNKFKVIDDSNMSIFPESLQKLYLEAKSGKNAASEFALGQIYESGNEILISDANKAEYWYNLAAEKGYLPAQEALAALFLKHKQKDLALQWNLKSAENGSSVGQFYSSVLLLENPSKTEEAISMLKMAVKQDYIGAYSLLGTFYLQGKHVELNVEKGMKYLKRAVPSNDPLALHNLAIAYKKGVGTRPDMERALAYFELAKAAESSNSYPQLDKKAILGDEFITTFAY